MDPKNPVYSADQIVGKTLIAKAKVTLYNLPYDDAAPIGSVQPGQTVGIVVSWLDADPSSGRSRLYWQFVDSSGNFFYAPHYTGEFDVQSLVDQGALTAGQITQAAADAHKSVFQQEIEKYAPWLIGSVLGIAVLSVILKRTL